MLTNGSFVLLGLGVLAGLWYERDTGLGFGLLCGNDIGYWYGSLVWLARGEEDYAVYTFFFVQLCWFWEYLRNIHVLHINLSPPGCIYDIDLL